MKTEEIFLNNSSIAIDLIRQYEYPYMILPNIKNYILELGKSLDDNFEKIGDDVWIHKSATVAPNALIQGPCIIDENAEIRNSAYIRGSAIIGKGSILGNSCEIKNAILFDCVQVPHFNYVGDSILGYRSHMGAGSITSNVKSDKTLVKINYNGKVYETNLKKVGSFLGDYVEIGCNCVLNPGTIIGNNTNVYPLTSVRGYIPKESIVKNMDNIIKKEVR